MRDIRGLYFKLNMNKQTDKDIYNFFNQESELRSVNKIEILYAMMIAYKQIKHDKNILNCMKALINITEHECYTYGEDTAVAFANRFIRCNGGNND